MQTHDKAIAVCQKDLSLGARTHTNAMRTRPDTEFSLPPLLLPPEWIVVMSVPRDEYTCKWPNDA